MLCLPPQAVIDQTLRLTQPSEWGGGYAASATLLRLSFLLRASA